MLLSSCTTTESKVVVPPPQPPPHCISHGENNDLLWCFLQISSSASQAEKYTPHFLGGMHLLFISKVSFEKLLLLHSS